MFKRGLMWWWGLGRGVARCNGCVHQERGWAARQGGVDMGSAAKPAVGARDLWGAGRWAVTMPINQGLVHRTVPRRETPFWAPGRVVQGVGVKAAHAS